MNITFLDVGAHEGQTLAEVTKPIYPFTMIHAFEPMPVQFNTLQDAYADDRRVMLHNVGLLDRTCDMPVYGTNERMEASIFPTKRDLDPSVSTMCAFVDVNIVMNALPDGRVIMKLNCEGSETIIVDRLLTTGAIWDISELLIDFDVRKITGEEHREVGLLARLAAAGFTRFSIADEVMTGETHQNRIASWLHATRARWETP
jgi:FkbM family methyltransferase